jgi:signal transduction histidine kinase
LVELLNAASPPAPLAGLRIVEALVRRVQAPGLSVRCQFSGESEELSEESAEVAYRLVQEGVTNAMKHAPGAPIEISMRGLAEAVEIRVVNGAARGGLAALEGVGGGHGLAGMRERVARCGGTLSAGPTVDRGWHVTAHLPRHRGLEMGETGASVVVVGGIGPPARSEGA